jgi:hypothetical protein
MERYVRPAAMVATIGAIAVGLAWFANNLPPAMAHEQPMQTLMSNASELFPKPFDASNLYRAKGKTYAVTAEEGYSLKPISQQIVRKIGYGKTKFVTISTTASGVYSSDGLVSPHIRYPGIHTQRVIPVLQIWGSIAYWSAEDGWVSTAAADADSFAVIAE